MIDKLRSEIESRIEVLQREAEALRRALAALGSGDGEPSARRSRAGRGSASTTHRSRSPSGGQASGRRSAGGRRATPSSTAAASTESSRSAARSTKSTVLSALSGGEAMTAGQIAAATGLGRASVSTTLSKMAKTGEVTKADRGYRLTGAAKQAA